MSEDMKKKVKVEKEANNDKRMTEEKDNKVEKERKR